MKNYSHKGAVLSLPAPYNLLSGTAFMVGAIFAVAVSDAVAGAEVEAKTHGVYQLPKNASQAWAAGARIYWDSANKRCDTASSAGPLIGAAVYAVAASATIGAICLGGAIGGAGAAPVSATSISLTGPTAATVGQAATYQVALSPAGSTVASPVVVTPTAVAGVTFAPASVTLTTASPSATFAATSSTAGTKAIAVTNNGGLTNPAAISLVVSAASTAPLAPVLESVVGFNTRADVNVRPAAGDTATITGYRITASPGGATVDKAGAGPCVATVTGLTNGTDYTFTAKALYSGGEGPVSNSASATPVVNRVLHATMGGVCTYDGVHTTNTFGSIDFQTAAAYDMPTGLSVRFANMAVIGTNEGGGGNTDTWTGSVELGGTLYQLQKSAASPITVSTNTVVETDRVGAGLITKGTVLRFRLWTNQPGKIKFFTYGDGDGVIRQKFGTSSAAVPDITMQMDQSSLTLTPVGQVQPLILPFMIVGEIDGPSLKFDGDSISVARGDYAGSTVGRGYMGRAAKALGVAYAQLGKSGDTLVAYVGSHAIRRSANNGFTHHANNMGTNDTTMTPTPQTAAQIATNRATVIGHNAGKPQLWFNVIPNVASSSDGYTTVAGQTLRGTEPVRLEVNADLAAGVPGVRVVDINASLSAPGDPSRWGVGAGGVPWTLDAAHPTDAGCIVGAAGYDLSTFVKPV